jgi:hypothetical protein
MPNNLLCNLKIEFLNAITRNVLKNSKDTLMIVIHLKNSVSSVKVIISPKDFCKIDLPGKINLRI